jgi:FdhE protein
MPALQERTSVYADRRRRADELSARLPYATEPLRLYRALVDAQEPVFANALETRPAAGELASYVVATSLPRVLNAVMSAGTEVLRESVLLRFHDGDLEAIVRGWLDGTLDVATDVFLARAATSPVLEALPEVAATLRPGDDERRCPVCGGLPQLSVFTESGEALVTGQRRLVCSRCAAEWAYARMVCASCGATGGAKQPIFADEAQLPHLRIDACDVCRSYLVTVDVRRDAQAVPLVDEIAALPLDLVAAERGYTKISRNVMGF